MISIVLGRLKAFIIYGQFLKVAWYLTSRYIFVSGRRGIMQRVMLFRCIICGDPYIGFEKPTNCPFCGAHEKYIVPAGDWRDTNRVELTEESRKNLETSLQLEISNTEFYLCVSKRSRNEDIRAMFRALSKIESEHASTVCKILRVEKPGIEFKKGLCSSDDSAALEEADSRENRAVNLYTEFLKQATEPRVKQIFSALIEIESDHIDLINKERAEPEEKAEGPKERPEAEEAELEDKSEFYNSYKIHED
jgi:rubrerythrin